MSRTRHHKDQKYRHAGEDLWSKRPLSGCCYNSYNKKRSRRIERKRAKQEIDYEQDMD